MWFIPILALAAVPTPQPPMLLPDGIRTALEEEYPGWKLSPVTPQIQQTFKRHKLNRSPSFVSGDFDHDGKRDYALQIVLTTPGQEEQIVMFFLSRGET